MPRWNALAAVGLLESVAGAAVRMLYCFERVGQRTPPASWGSTRRTAGPASAARRGSTELPASPRHPRSRQQDTPLSCELQVRVPACEHGEDLVHKSLSLLLPGLDQASDPCTKLVESKKSSGPRQEAQAPLARLHEDLELELAEVGEVAALLELLAYTLW